MYSRAPRKFLTPDADHANPNLGPGCYTADEATLIAGKALGEEGYAPFASLAPRTSYFEETIIPGPAPGAYHNPLKFIGPQLSRKAAIFGKSQAPRFGKIVSKTPGPGSYTIPDALKGKNKKGGENGAGVAGDMASFHKGLEMSSTTHPLTKQPAMVSGVSLAGSMKDLSVREIESGVVEEYVGGDGGVGAGEEGSGDGSGLEATRMSLSARKLMKKKSIKTNKNEDASSRPPMVFSSGSAGKKKPTIVWRRKFVPPSIPVGTSAFGYQENDGETFTSKMQEK
jgi:hypothetical protein